ncbi:MAG: hypothetical protein JNK35_11100 [Phycisphaerae bacterium]|nr:hypothetical protein [Phycisphaerae bacterium]
MGGQTWTTIAILSWILAGTFGAGGLVLIMLGLFRDRQRHLRRCPKCWYHMHGIEGRTCPECGHTARGEPALFRRRRSARLIAVGLIVALLSAPLGLWPKIARDGWWTVTPTIVLIRLWPDSIPTWGAAVAPPPTIVLPGSPARRMVIGLPPGAPPPANPVKGAIENRLSGRLRDWETRALARRCATVLDTSTDAQDRDVALRWLAAMRREHMSAALPALARVASGVVPVPAPAPPPTPLPAVVVGGTVARAVAPASPEQQQAATVRAAALARFNQFSEAGRARRIIREIASAGFDTGSAIAAGPDAQAVARAAWAAALRLPASDQTAVGPLVSLTLADPLLLPDPVVKAMLADPTHAPALYAAIAQCMTALVESTDRCERLLIEAGPGALPALPHLLPIALGAGDWTLSRSCFRAIAPMGPAALADAGADLERAADGPSSRALWAGATLASLRDDTPLLLSVLSNALNPASDWDARHEALQMLHARTPLDGLIIDRVLLAAEHESTLLQLAAVEALERLAPTDPRLRAAVDRIALEGKPRAREAARAALARRPAVPAP